MYLYNSVFTKKKNIYSLILYTDWDKGVESDFTE